MDVQRHVTTLERGSRAEKLEAVRLLAQIGGARAASALARGLAHERDAEVAIASAQALRDLGQKRAVPALERLLESDLALADSGRATESVARAAVEALEVLAGPASLPAMVRYFENPRATRDVLPRVARWIAGSGEEGEFLVLRRALDLKSPHWSAAVQGLDDPRFRAHASALAALLPEADAHQAVLLIRTLGGMRAREQAPAIRRVVASGLIQDPLELRQVETVLTSLERDRTARVPSGAHRP